MNNEQMSKNTFTYKKDLFVKWRSGLTFVKWEILSDELTASPKHSPFELG